MDVSRFINDANLVIKQINKNVTEKIEMYNNKEPHKHILQLYVGMYVTLIECYEHAIFFFRATNNKDKEHHSNEIVKTYMKFLTAYEECYKLALAEGKEDEFFPGEKGRQQKDYQIYFKSVYHIKQLNYQGYVYDTISNKTLEINLANENFSRMHYPIMLALTSDDRKDMIDYLVKTIPKLIEMKEDPLVSVIHIADEQAGLCIIN